VSQRQRDWGEVAGEKQGAGSRDKVKHMDRSVIRNKDHRWKIESYCGG